MDDDIPIGLELSHNRLDLDRRRKRRAVEIPKSSSTTTAPIKENTPNEMNSDSNNSSEVMDPESASNESTNNSNNSEEQFDDTAPTVILPNKYSSKIIKKNENHTCENDADCIQLKGDIGDNAAGESLRSTRQLRPFPYTSPKWAGHNFRSIDTPSSVQQLNAQKTGYSFGNYNPYLTPSLQQAHSNHNYNQLSPIPTYKPYSQQQHQITQQQPTFVYTGYNLSLPPPPVEDDFRPITGNYYGAASLTSPRPQVIYQDQKNPGDLLPFIIQQLKEVKERRKQIQTENFAYFHLDNQPIITPTTPRSPFDYYSTLRPIQQVTPNGNGQHSTMGGFYNNKPDHASGKLISQYSIGQGPESLGTTESNYFQYNIIANQKMKGAHNTAKQNQIEHSIKLRPPVTPVQVTPNFNIVSAPNLAFNKPGNLQQIPLPEIPHLPVGISYASNNTLPESYQTFTKSISSTAVPKLPTTTTTTTTKQQEPTNFQFNINEFMANLKASDLASFNPAVNPLIKYFKQVSNDGSGNVRNAVVLRRPVTHMPTTTSTLRPALRTKAIRTTQPTAASTTRVPKGYEDFVKSIQSKNSTGIPRLTNGYSSTSTTTDRSVEYYDDEYDDGVNEDMLPPSRMPPYMPMSETMSPPRPQTMTTVRPSTAMPSSMRPYTQTGIMAATTTRRPFSNFAQLKQPNQGSSVPAFISFPSDIFQELRQRLPQLKATAPTDSLPIPVRVHSTTTTKTTSSPDPTRTRNTARPQRTRGQHKWHTQVMDNLNQGSERPQNETNRGSKSSASADGLGGLHLNSIHINSSAERQRYL